MKKDKKNIYVSIRDHNLANQGDLIAHQDNLECDYNGWKTLRKIIRPATDEEKEAYYCGLKNIKDIPGNKKAEPMKAEKGKIYVRKEDSIRYREQHGGQAGDIVKCLSPRHNGEYMDIGWMLKYSPMKYFRPATEEEIKAYESGCKNINDMNKKPEPETSNLKLEDLKADEVYFFKSTNGTEYIIQKRWNASGKLLLHNYIDITRKKAGFKCNFFVMDLHPYFNIIRLATPEEMRWLEACEKEGKYVSKEEVAINDYRYMNTLQERQKFVEKSISKSLQKLIKEEFPGDIDCFKTNNPSLNRQKGLSQMGNIFDTICPSLPNQVFGVDPYDSHELNPLSQLTEPEEEDLPIDLSSKSINNHKINLS